MISDRFGSTLYGPPLPTATTIVATDGSSAAPQPEKRRPPFAIALPTFMVSVVVFAEAWEYDDEDEDDMVEDEYADLIEDRRHPSTSSRTAPGQGGKVKLWEF